MSDRHFRAGSKPGAGGMASREAEGVARKERLRQLAMETSDISKDPYFMRNHLGTFECRLCLTLHSTEGNYLAHTQGRRHQTNLARRAAREKQRAARSARRSAPEAPTLPLPEKIGTPGFRVSRSRDETTKQRTLHFEIDYPRIESGIQPRHRLMSTYEQKVEATDSKWQFLVVSAIPYQNIAFKIPNSKIDRTPGKFSTTWNAGPKVFTIDLVFE